jgi:thiol-disulfide isomerase/thioredoxin
MKVLVLLFCSLLLLTTRTHAQADFTKDVAEGPGTFENIVPDGWFKNGEEGDEADVGNVLFITDKYWDAYRRDTERFLVFFHAADCKWCTYSKPGLVGASRKFRRSMPFLAIDCKGAGAGTCSKLGLVSFPRLKYFQRNFDEPEDPNFFENGAKDSGDFVTYVEKKLDDAERATLGVVGDNVDVTKTIDSEIDISKLKKLRVKQLRKLLKERGQRCVGCTDKSEFVQRVKESLHLPVLSATEQKQRKSGGAIGGKGKKRKRKTLMQEKRERVLRKLAKKGWSEEEYGNGKIVHSHDGHFEELYLSKQAETGGTALVYFYAPWCKHCQDFKPELVALSEEIADEGMTHEIVAIDADASKELNHKYKIKTFPTCMFFRGGKEDSELYNYEGRPRAKKDLYKFLRRLEDPDFMPEPEGEFVNEMRWGEEDVKVEAHNGQVVFLTHEHYNPWMKRGEFDQGAMVLFYTDWCHHCKSMKPHYAQVSRLLSEQMPDVKIIAMECDNFGRDICRKKYKIHNFPTMYFFYPLKNRELNPELGEYEEYEGPRDYETVVKAVIERCDPKYEYYNAKVDDEEDGGGIDFQEQQKKKPPQNKAKVVDEVDEEDDFEVPSSQQRATEIVEDEVFEEEDQGIENEMTAKEMRSEVIATIGRIGNPDSLMKVLEYARSIEEQDEEDDFENVGKEEL